jgi:hypothetical protein
MPRVASDARAHCIPRFHPVRKTQVFRPEKILHTGIARRSIPFKVNEAAHPPPIAPIPANAGAKEIASVIRHLQKIPKPAGEPGHPGSNGYSLREALDWDLFLYQDVQKSVRKLATQYLDKTSGWGSQDEQKQQSAIAAVSVSPAIKHS